MTGDTRVLDGISGLMNKSMYLTMTMTTVILRFQIPVPILKTEQ